jgi:hypothetical protein
MYTSRGSSSTPISVRQKEKKIDPSIPGRKHEKHPELSATVDCVILLVRKEKEKR